MGGRGESDRRADARDAWRALLPAPPLRARPRAHAVENRLLRHRLHEGQQNDGIYQSGEWALRKVHDFWKGEAGIIWKF